jgi:RNA polymerase sigma-70 factor, ECF subfamily
MRGSCVLQPRQVTDVDEDRIRLFVADDYPRVVAAVTLVCGDRGAAEDSVQEALVSAWLHRGEIGSLTGWVVTAAMNRGRSRRRRREAESRAYERWNRTAAAPVVDLDPSDGTLASALARLPRRQREVVVLHYHLDLGVAEVAEVLGVAEGTVKTSLHRARATLRNTWHRAPEEATDATA